MDARALAAALKSEGVLVTAADGTTLRFVTSSRVSADDVREAVEVIRGLVAPG
jgi:threonine aldolase